jgi:hypothetical protein
METENLEIRFGVLAVKKGFVTPDQVVTAMNVQVAEDLKSGSHRPIGIILRDQEIITVQQVNEVLSTLERQNK